MKTGTWQHYHASNNVPLLSQQDPIDHNPVNQYQVIHQDHHQTCNTNEIFSEISFMILSENTCEFKSKLVN